MANNTRTFRLTSVCRNKLEENKMIIGIPLLVIMIAITVVVNLRKSGCLDEGICVVIGFGYVIAALLLGVGAGTHIQSLYRFADIEAFSAVSKEYADAIDKTADAVVRLDDGEIGVAEIAAMVDVGISVENLKHSSMTAERIREARNYRRYIIETRHYYRMVTQNWFLKMFIAKPPKSLYSDSL